MAVETETISAYMTFYKYLTVLSAEQIVKLRKIATGILSLSAFSEDEIQFLESSINLQSN